MQKNTEPVYAFCQYCKEKTEMSQDYVLSTGKVRTLRGKCKSCQKPMQLIVGKDYELP